MIPDETRGRNLESVPAPRRQDNPAVAEDRRQRPHWERYFRSGYYPFCLEGESQYENRIRLAVNQTLDVDWPSVEDITAATIRRARKMMRILVELPPQTPKMKSLYAELDTERQHGLKMLYALERARLLNLMPSEHEALDDLTSPEKIYLDNTNMMYAIVGDADIGTARGKVFRSDQGRPGQLCRQ